MSAAATAAGYLYASGRLRGRNKVDHEKDIEAHYPHVTKAVDKTNRREIEREEAYEASKVSPPYKPTRTTKVTVKKSKLKK